MRGRGIEVKRNEGMKKRRRKRGRGEMSTRLTRSVKMK